MPDKATETQLANIQKKTGKTLDELATIVRGSGLAKHGEIRDMLMSTLALGHGDANTLVHAVLKTAGGSLAADKSPDAVLDEIYTGAKAHMRAIHDALMMHIDGFGEFEIAPKKGYVSLRRKKQFAMLGPKTNTRFEVGINAKDLPAHPRLLVQPKASMSPYVVNLASATDVDAELIAWIRTSYESAG